MKIHQLHKWIIPFLPLFFIFISVAQAQITPQLLKDDPEINQLVYFGMPLNEFKQRLANRIVECKPTPDKKIGDTLCKIKIGFAVPEISSAVGVFNDERMVAFVTRVDSEKYPSVIREFQSSLGSSPVVEPKIVDKGFFSKKIENEYSTWLNQNYKLMVSKFDIPRYKQNDTNFSVIYESVSFTETVSEVTTSTSTAEAQGKPQIKRSNDRLKSKIKRTYDEFRKQSEYTGEDVLDGFGEVFLRGIKPDNGEPIFQIYVADLYQGPWRYYRTTWDSDGTKLDTVQITRNVVSCGGWECYRNEEVAIIITRDYLEQHRTKGLRFKLSGSGGEYIFTVPAAHIDAFLDVVN